jgi:hypothetical protein
MARDHARIAVRVWSDPDFIALKPDAQLVYFMLISNPDLSWCGVADYVPTRFLRLSDGMTARRFEVALEALRANRFVLIDERTAEILVRSYVRHDGLLKQPNVAKAMVKAVERTHSDALRDAVLIELVRAKREDPVAKGWRGVEVENKELFAYICEKASGNPSGNPLPNPFRKASENG